MKIDTISICLHAVLLHHRSRVHAYIAESEGGPICRSTIMINESPNHKNVVAGSNFSLLHNFFRYEHA
jgi:hypothetical protein